MRDDEKSRPGSGSLGEKSADFLINLAMASLALLVTAVSGYTTYKGMIRIVGADAATSGAESWLPTIVALSITAVVQIGLTILCWVMGRDFARAITARLHERRQQVSVGTLFGKAGAMLMLLAICLAVSIFYSFNTYFNSMYEGKEERRVEAQSVPAVALEVSTLLNQAISDRKASDIGKLSDLAKDSGYFGQLQALSQTVKQTEARFAVRLEEIKAAKIEADKQRVATEFDTKALVDATSRTIEASRADIERLVGEISAIETGIVEAEARIASLASEEKTNRNEAERQLRGDEERASGKGRVYAKSLAAADIAAQGIVAAVLFITQSRNKLVELGAKRLEIEKSIGIAQIDIDAADPAASQAAPDQDLPMAAFGSIGVAIDNLENARLAFEQSPVRQAYELLQDECTKLRDLGLADLVARSEVELVTCNAGSDVFDNAVSNFTLQQAKREEYEQKCASLADGQLGSAKAAATLRQCHFLALSAGVDADSRKAEKAFAAVEAFASKFDKDQHPFLKTLQAFSVSPRLAMLALFFATIQDVAVFIMTFMVEFFRREREFAREERAEIQLGENDIEAIRYVLSKCDPVPGRRDSYVFRLTPDRVAFLSTDEILAIKAVIEDLRGRNMAHATSRIAYIVSNLGFVTMQNRLRKSPGGTDNRPDSAGFGLNTPRALQAAAARMANAAENSENVLEISSRKKSS